MLMSEIHTFPIPSSSDYVTQINFLRLFSCAVISLTVTVMHTYIYSAGIDSLDQTWRTSRQLRAVDRPVARVSLLRAVT